MTTLYLSKVSLSLLMFLLVSEVIGQLSSKAGNCPLRDSVNRCVPRCTTDYQCSFNEKCCPNRCGSTSCASTSAVSTGDDGGYKGSYGSKTVYCAGVKCSTGEKCVFDRRSKREKCSRA